MCRGIVGEWECHLDARPVGKGYWCVEMYFGRTGTKWWPKFGLKFAMGWEVGRHGVGAD